MLEALSCKRSAEFQMPLGSYRLNLEGDDSHGNWGLWQCSRSAQEPVCPGERSNTGRLLHQVCSALTKWSCPSRENRSHGEHSFGCPHNFTCTCKPVTQPWLSAVSLPGTLWFLFTQKSKPYIVIDPHWLLLFFFFSSPFLFLRTLFLQILLLAV